MEIVAEFAVGCPEVSLEVTVTHGYQKGLGVEIGLTDPSDDRQIFSQHSNRISVTLRRFFRRKH